VVSIIKDSASPGLRSNRGSEHEIISDSNRFHGRIPRLKEFVQQLHRNSALDVAAERCLDDDPVFQRHSDYGPLKSKRLLHCNDGCEQNSRDLKVERDQLDAAIMAIERLSTLGPKRRGRRPNWMKAAAEDAPKRPGRPPGSKNKAKEE
jgi:hypothetical protein